MASLTPLAFAALGLLNEAPMHPYEMFQTMLQRREDENVKVRPGTLYHQIGRLVDLGFAEALGTAREGNRPERTTYAITDHGRTELQAGLRRMIAEPADEYPEFQLAVSHVDNLSAADAVTALRTRAEALRDQRAEYDEAATGLQAKHLAERFWLDVSYVRAMLQAQIEWLSTTADRIASGDIPWDGPAVPEDTDIPTNSKEPTR
ncbi:PadR family transcriptional regulator [Curtobacterium pusillum]|uniref:PadR family transcriptional regulator n=1 Tax=Curtobacterium pusillum TaxID=69373 RepID=A0ABX2M9H5_9MICO|nr:PadR family transcriptional regulator [Curtobacterium pusillum]NUU14605.1 PadR family transcriptional regulator [Curtobacterium pusillum]GLK31961.1 PadR family transcriptional regulator [Curtobacterium pusillum]